MSATPFGLPAALSNRDYARATAILDRMAWIGRDAAAPHIELGLLLSERGVRTLLSDTSSAASRSSRIASRAMRVSPLTHGRRGDWNAAAAAYEALLAVAPNDADAAEQAAEAFEQIANPVRAAELRSRAAELRAAGIKRSAPAAPRSGLLGY